MNSTIIKNIPPNEHVIMQNSITDRIWPEFMLHDPVANNNWGKLFEYFDDFQFTLQMDGKPAGGSNGMAVFWDASPEDLPEGGWDWVFEKGIEQHEKGQQPNTAVGLQVNVAPEFRGQGLSTQILKEMKHNARNKGLKRLIIPVRPVWKSRYPLIPIDDYIRWETEEELPYDPWLRTHVRAGGRIIAPCYRSMFINGTIKEWETWTGMKFYQNGLYVVPGALTLVEMDLDSNKGFYVEPNVWVIHETDR